MFKDYNNTKILTLTGIFAVFAVTMVTGPLALTMGVNDAFAKSNHKGNNGDQSTEQGQYSDQNSQCVSGESIVLSCNNIAYKEQANGGNSASGQQGGDRGSSNDADQSTEQEQKSRQNSQCVSGESIVLSCNNLSFKEQENEGHSASGQQGGDRGSSNDADQSTEQEQASEQDAQCVSGEEAIVSCNNAEFQNMVNSGNRALAQD